MQHDDTGSGKQASYSEQAARTNADTNAQSPQPHGSQLDSGFTTNVNFENPGAPGGAGMLPSAGDVGALDPGGGGDIGGEDLAHLRGETTDFPATQQARHEGATPAKADSEDSVGGGSSTTW
ncbi:MAG: hypothetical protein CYG59_06870 [Chloroflexi bacterium]|nr:MAG: hypothetical protein CYG59_06870 [Chloroflexota bacterium]